MAVVTRPSTARCDPAPLLWLLAGVGWIAMIALMLVPAAMAGMPSMAAAGLAGAHGASSPVRTVAVFAGGWFVMVVAMMLPTTIPMARLFAVVTDEVPSRSAVRTAFAAAYLAVWSAAGLVGLAGAVLVLRTSGGALDGPVLAGALALAGLFQFSPLKKRCLTLCREPRAFLFTRYRRGVGAAWSLGVRHALACLGCCWALMAVMFTVGVGGTAWMLGLTAAMVAEKTAPWGRRLVVPIGVVLLVAAVVVAASTVLDPGAPAAVPMPAQHH